VWSFDQRDATCLLVTTALDGCPAYEVLLTQSAKRRLVMAQLACFLRRLHRNPVADCPFESDLQTRLNDA